MFKIGMALVFSVIAALIVFIAGMFGDARVTTALLRSLVAFLCAGAFTYLVTFILEAKGWAAFDKDPAARMQDMQAQLYDPDEIDFDAVEKGERGAAEFRRADELPAAFGGFLCPYEDTGQRGRTCPRLM